METLALVAGVATWYAGAYVDQPLYCGGVYTDTTAPWIALPSQDYGDTWQCGDLVALWFVDQGELLLAHAMDAGPFGDHCIALADGCAPIVADVPLHLWPGGDALSSPVEMVNVTGMARKADKLGYLGYAQ